MDYVAAGHYFQDFNALQSIYITSLKVEMDFFALKSHLPPLLNWVKNMFFWDSSITPTTAHDPQRTTHDHHKN